MDDDKPHLHIDFVQPNTVLLKRNEFVKDTDWKLLIRWWNEESHYHHISDKFLLPFEVFTKKMSWLRISWKEIGTFSFTQELKEQLGKQKQIMIILIKR